MLGKVRPITQTEKRHETTLTRRLGCVLLLFLSRNLEDLRLLAGVTVNCQKTFRNANDLTAAPPASPIRKIFSPGASHVCGTWGWSKMCWHFHPSLTIVLWSWFCWFLSVQRPSSGQYLTLLCARMNFSLEEYVIPRHFQLQLLLLLFEPEEPF